MHDLGDIAEKGETLTGFGPPIMAETRALQGLSGTLEQGPHGAFGTISRLGPVRVGNVASPTEPFRRLHQLTSIVSVKPVDLLLPTDSMLQ